MIRCLAKTRTRLSPAASFLYGGNAAYVEQLQSRYEANPASVDAEWRAFFESLKDDRADVHQERQRPLVEAAEHRACRAAS